MNKLAFVFPGQGSQSVGMMSDWGEHQHLINDTFAEASEALGYDLLKMCHEGPVEQLNHTENTQPAMLTAGVAAHRVWCHLDLPAAAFMAGHSLGEYTALVNANSMSFADAVKLVQKRGQLMQSAVAEGEGAMAAIIGLADDQVTAACAQVENGVVAAVNFNSPGQVVIAGNRGSVDQAMKHAKELGAKRCLPLPVSVPSHCSLMETAATALFDQLQKLQINLPSTAVIHNQSAAQADTAEHIKDLLKRQLSEPVLWVDCVNTMQQSGVEQLIEFGPGKVLTGLTRRINKSMSALAVFDEATLLAAQQQLTEND